MSIKKKSRKNQKRAPGKRDKTALFILLIRIPLGVLSHTRTVVRECCKDDDQSQWERPKFDPPPHPKPLTDRHQNLPT